MAIPLDGKEIFQLGSTEIYIAPFEGPRLGCWFPLQGPFNLISGKLPYLFPALLLFQGTLITWAMGNTLSVKGLGLGPLESLA